MSSIRENGALLTARRHESTPPASTLSELTTDAYPWQRYSIGNDHAESVKSRRGDTPVKTHRDEIQESAYSLPDDASTDVIQYHLYVRHKILKGLEAAEQGRTLTHEEVMRRMARRLPC